MRWLHSALLAVSLIASSAPGMVRADGIALVVVREKGAPEPIGDAVEAFLVEAAAYYPEQRIMTGPIARKKLKKALERCGDDPECVAHRSSQFKFDAVLLARVGPGEEGGAAVVIATFIIITRDRVRPHEYSFKSAEEVQGALAKSFFSIAGITTPGRLEVTGATGTIDIDGKPYELAEGQVGVAPGMHRFTLNGVTQEALVLPRETTSLPLEGFTPPPGTPATSSEPDAAHGTATASSTPTTTAAPSAAAATASPSAAEPAATATEPPPASTATTEASGGMAHGLVLYGGYGLAASGVLLLGGGAYFGTRTKVTVDAATSQAEAQRLNKRADRAANSANLLLISGSIAVASGAALWAVASFAMSSGPTVALVPSRDGLALTMQGAF